LPARQKFRPILKRLLPGVNFLPRKKSPPSNKRAGSVTAGIVIEWIQGEGGIFPVSEAYGRKARELADRYNALLIFDEIQCGVGRPGTWVGYQLATPVVLPDAMVAAKPLACGLPLGVIVANEKAAAAIGAGMHGST